MKKPPITTKALILSTTQYGEKALIFKTLTETKGKISIYFSPSATKTHKTIPEALDHGELFLNPPKTEGSLYRYTNESYLKSPHKLRLNHWKLVAALFSMEVIDVLTTNENSDDGTILPIALSHLDKLITLDKESELLKESYYLGYELMRKTGFGENRSRANQHELTPRAVKNLISDLEQINQAPIKTANSMISLIDKLKLQQQQIRQQN